MNKEEFLQFMETLYSSLSNQVNEIPEYIRQNLRTAIVDSDLRLCYLIVDRKTCDKITKWVNHYEK